MKSLVHNSGGGQVDVTVDYEGALRQVTWRVAPDGWLECDYSYEANGSQDCLGVFFDYPEASVKSKRWLGNGPYRVWKNRMVGNTLNVWENEYNNTITGYTDWEYPEFKGCFGGVRWMQLVTDEGDITIAPSSPDIFVQVLTPEQPPEKLRGRTSVLLPQCGLALLDAIPPIGSKFKAAATTGPQGQPTEAAGRTSGSVKFSFSE
jgi:hypothetical protein